jgi:hypothetical protein
LVAVRGYFAGSGVEYSPCPAHVWLFGGIAEEKAVVEKREVRLVSRLDRGPIKISQGAAAGFISPLDCLDSPPNELPVGIPPSILTLLQVNIGCLGYVNSSRDFN